MYYGALQHHGRHLQQTSGQHLQIQSRIQLSSESETVLFSSIRGNAFLLLVTEVAAAFPAIAPPAPGLLSGPGGRSAQIQNCLFRKGRVPVYKYPAVAGRTLVKVLNTDVVEKGEAETIMLNLPMYVVCPGYRVSPYRLLSAPGYVVSYLTGTY